MILRELRIEGFGIWREQRLDGLSDGLNVFYGANEAGKTTLMQFVRSMLYGFSPERRERYLPPLGAAPAGGSLVVRDDDELLALTRSVDGHGFESELAISAPDGEPRTAERLRRMLSTIDEPVFNHVFALGLRDFQELGTLSDTRASEHLFRIAGGLDRVSLVEVMGELAASRHRLIAADERPSEVPHLVSQRDQAQTEIQELRGLVGQYGQLQAEQREIDQELSLLETEKATAAERLARLETARRLSAPLVRRDALDAELEQLGTAPDVPAGMTERLAQLKANRELAQQRLAKLRPRLKHLATTVGRMSVHEELWKAAPKIELLCDQQEWIADLEGQRDAVAAEIRELEGQLSGKGQHSRLTGKKGDQPTAAVVASLRAAAKKVSRERTALAEAEKTAQQAREGIAALDQQITGGLAGRGKQALTDALEQAGAKVTQLRRRLALDERVEQQARQLKGLEAERMDLLDEQVMPSWVIASLGGVFGLGIVLILAGMILPLPISDTFSLGLAALGLVGTAAAGAAKIFLQQVNEQNLERCENQLTILSKQAKQAQQERDELDKQIPKGGGTLTMRVQAAEKELAALEELAPLDARKHGLTRDIEAADAGLAHRKEQLERARREWRTGLAAAGLPPNFSPRGLRALAQDSRRMSGISRLVDERRAELAQRDRGLAQFQQRVTPLASLASLSVEGRRASELLGALRRSFADVQAVAVERDALEAKRLALRKRERKLLRALTRFKRQRRQLLDSARVENEDDLRRLAELQSRIFALESDRKSAQAEIMAALAGRYREDELRAVSLDVASDEVFAARTGEQTKQIAHCEQRARKLLEHRGELGAQAKTLVADRRLPNKQLDRTIADERIRRSAERWQVLAITWSILERLRREYEHKRQPETLHTASEYFEQLSEGKYRRIWTPLGEPVLRVDDRDGTSLPVEVLSRGTREQLYLALRLALAKSYAKRGVRLPLVMDDLLVNFDAARAKAAAVVLRDFAAEGHQLLLFTCHDHIQRIFRALRVPVRPLPGSENDARAFSMDLPVTPVTRPPRMIESPPPVSELEFAEPLVEEVAPPRTEVRVRRVERPARPVATHVTRRWHVRTDWGAEEFAGEFAERRVGHGMAAGPQAASKQGWSREGVEEVTVVEPRPRRKRRSAEADDHTASDEQTGNSGDNTDADSEAA
ncbi:MAG: AAA family ATPase [Pirellulales bacterium]|nr:AAA family ATPase [Pirellulales bacterium]